MKQRAGKLWMLLLSLALCVGLLAFPVLAEDAPDVPQIGGVAWTGSYLRWETDPNAAWYEVQCYFRDGSGEWSPLTDDTAYVDSYGYTGMVEFDLSYYEEPIRNAGAGEYAVRVRAHSSDPSQVPDSEWSELSGSYLFRETASALPPPALSCSWEIEYEDDGFYLFDWVLPVKADMEWRLVYRASDGEEEELLESGSVYPEQEDPYHPSLYPYTLREKGPGQYTLYARTCAYDGIFREDVFSDWVETGFTYDAQRLPQPADVRWTPDGTVCWTYDADALSEVMEFRVAMYREGDSYPRDTFWVDAYGEGEWSYNIDTSLFEADSTYRCAVYARPDMDYSDKCSSKAAFCEDSLTTASADSLLPPPGGIFWDQESGCLRWDAVEGASGYRVRVHYPSSDGDDTLWNYDTLVRTNALDSFESWIYERFENQPTTFYFTFRSLSGDVTRNISSDWDHEYWGSDGADNRDELFSAEITLGRPAAPAPSDLRAELTFRAGTIPLALLSWTGAEGTDYYRLRVSRQGEDGQWRELFSRPAGTEENPAEIEVLTALAEGPGTLRFEVSAVPRDDSCRQSDWAVYDYEYTAAPLAAPTDLSWDSASNTLRFTPVSSAASYALLVYMRDSEDAEPWLYSTIRIRGPGYRYLPHWAGYYSFAVASLGEDILTSAPGLSSFTEEVYLEPISLGAAQGLRFDPDTAALCWEPVENASGYSITASADDMEERHIEIAGETSLSLLSFAFGDSELESGRTVQFTVTPFVNLGDSRQDGTSGMLSVRLSPDMLDPFRDADGLIPLGAADRLFWGRAYDHSYGNEEWGAVPGVLSYSLKHPFQNNLLVRVYDASDDKLVRWTRWYFGAYDTTDMHSDDTFLMKCFETDSVRNEETGSLEERGPLPEGDYYYTVQYLGDGMTYRDGAVVRSETWHYVPAPAGTELPAPRVDSFTLEEDYYGPYPESETETRLTVRWSYEGNESLVYEYEVEFLFTPDPLASEPRSIGSSWGSFRDHWDSLWDEQIQENGNGFYYARVRAISSDITRYRHSEWSEMLPYDLREKTQVVSEALENAAANLGGNATAEEVRDEVFYVVDELGTEALELAMLADQRTERGDAGSTGILETLEQLERQAGGPAEVMIDGNASAKIRENFRAGQVSILGANLNAPRETGGSAPEDLALVIGSPKGGDVIPELYDQTLSVRFSMELTGVENSHALTVPVQVTLPIPAHINPSFLHILHYRTDGSREELWPHIYEKDGQHYAQIVLSSFSDFAMVVEKSAVSWEQDTDAGTLTVQVKLDREAAPAEDGWLALCVYDPDGRMLDRLLQPLTAAETEAALSLTNPALTEDGFMAKVFWLDEGFVPLAEALVSPSGK